ncbi:MAG TPA: Gfo/Idh/MocA family oxidoreductase [Terriglobales bacterium]|nr:Gfo/Idh/MocA family oxidoreductase [Terriglobales bacterium]
MTQLQNYAAGNGSEKLKIGLVGSGYVGQAYAQAFAGYSRASLVAVADLRPEAARDMAEGLKCASFDSYESMAEAVDLDAVIVCTPPVTHPEISTYFLTRGVHVLCEKPLSIDVESARSMMETARSAGTQLIMASKFRHVDDVVRAKSLVTSGIIGDVVLFENSFTSQVDMSSRWNSMPQISGGGVLIDNGTHSVDMMRYFLGPLAEVHALEGKRTQGLPVEDTVHILARSVSGVVATSDLSWTINKERESYIDIYGSQGMVSVGWRESKYRHFASPNWLKFGSGYSKSQAFRNQVDNFVLTLRGEVPSAITVQDSLASVQVIAAAYTALHRRQWTPVLTDDFAEELVGVKGAAL